MALHAEIDKHLKSANLTYTVSGTQATVTGTVSHQRMEELIAKAQVTNHDLVLAAGALVVKPR
jgi:hypothetical protein